MIFMSFWPLLMIQLRGSPTNCRNNFSYMHIHLRFVWDLTEMGTRPPIRKLKSIE